MSDPNIESTQESPENQAPTPKVKRERGPKEIPEIADQWLTSEIEELLKAIEGPHIPKKRQTVIRLAFALANQQPVSEVFDLPETCDKRIWYMKWQHDPAIKAAYEACYTRALEWTDQATAAIEAHYRLIRRQKMAKHAADAPDALAAVMKGDLQPGSHRISAANALIGWADPKAAEQVRPASPASSVEQVINLVANLAEEDLDSELERLEQRRKSALLSAAEGAGEPPAGTAEAPGTAGESIGEADT